MNNGKTNITMIEFYDSHWYKVQVGKRTEFFASATTKLGVVAKPYLAQWRGDLGNREADLRLFEAQERGTRIHHAWYTLTTGGAVLYQPRLKPNYSRDQVDRLMKRYDGNIALVRYQDEMFQIYKLQRMLATLRPGIVSSEIAVYSLKHKDAGTIDNVFDIEEGEYYINGSRPLYLPKGRYVADLKTGASVQDEAWLQTACYANCYEEMDLGEIEGTLIIHTGSKNVRGIEGLSVQYHNSEELKDDTKAYRHAAALWERKNKDTQPKVFEFPKLITMEET